MVLIENKQLSTIITLTVVFPLRCLITSIEFLILELIFLVVFLHNLQSSLLFLSMRECLLSATLSMNRVAMPITIPLTIITVQLSNENKPLTTINVKPIPNCGLFR